ncbi:hypothetical protein LWI29_013888 [Acer saccharum]|uniref:Nodulin-like domain-containing protein n=1 Tax=Acer saccharum TaxID=4024 RepID=A0AA39SH14_ACESA|nr:hypothetical protein LWI29_013888 [Acer saccharum]
MISTISFSLQRKSMLVPEKLKSFLDNRWLVFVCAIWVLGEFVGFLAGGLVEVFPIWSIMLNFVGYGLIWLLVTSRLPTLPLWILSTQPFFYCLFVNCFSLPQFVQINDLLCSYASLYLSEPMTRHATTQQLWLQNFPRNRGPIVGILKGFAGLTGAIVTQIP